MAATKYQILYRFINPNANQFVTNDSKEEYEQILELYHDEHKINDTNKEIKLEAENEKSKLIIDGNNTANDNYSMLFKFTGTKRINKKTWMPQSTGYVIRDKEVVKDKITRAVDGDYSGDYLLIEGDTIENGIVIAKKNITSEITVVSDASRAENQIYYTTEELKNLIIESTIYQLNINDNDIKVFMSGFSSTYINRTGYPEYREYDPVFTGPVFIDKAPTQVKGNYKSAFGILGNGSTCDYACRTIRILPGNVKSYTIPPHYEEVAEFPYAICDTYERIEQTPWVVLSTHSSLTSALEKAQTIVKSIGIDNVKIIKVVPTEQFIKIN